MPRCTAWGSVRSSKEHNRAVWGFTSTCHKHTSMPLENTHHLKTHSNVIRQCGRSRSNSPDPRPTPPSPWVLVTPSFPHPPGPQMTLKSGSSSHIIIITQCSRRSNSPAPRPTHFHPWGLGSLPPPHPPPPTQRPQVTLNLLKSGWSSSSSEHFGISCASSTMICHYSKHSSRQTAWLAIILNPLRLWLNHLSASSLTGSADQGMWFLFLLRNYLSLSLSLSNTHVHTHNLKMHACHFSTGKVFQTWWHRSWENKYHAIL